MDAPIYNGTPIPILGSGCDWSSNPVLRVIYKTGIYEALDLSEERHQKYPRALYGIQFQTVALGSQEQGTLRKQFETAQALPYLVPLWTEAVYLTGDAPAGSASLGVSSVNGTLFQLFQYALIWRDWQTWELVQLAGALVDTAVPLSAGTVSAWQEGDLLVPLTFGYLKRPDFEAIDADNAAVQIDFEERFQFAWQDTTEIPTLPMAPTVTYSDGCMDTFTVDFGGRVPNLRRFQVYHSDNPDGPWDFYCQARRERKRLVFNNYFNGSKYLKIELILWKFLGSGDTTTEVRTVMIFKPLAPAVQRPTITLGPGFTAPSVAFNAPMAGVSPDDPTKLVGIAADFESINYVTQHRNLTVPAAGEAFVQIDYKGEVKQSSFAAWPSDSTDISVSTADGEAVIRWTIDGTDPTETNGMTASSFLLTNSYLNTVVVIARCFKGGCKSPPTYVAIDRNINWAEYFGTNVSYRNSSMGCDLWNHQFSPPECNDLYWIARSCDAFVNGNVPAFIEAFGHPPLYWEANYIPEIFGLFESMVPWTDGMSGSIIPLIYLRTSDAVQTGATTGNPALPCDADNTWTDGSLSMTVSEQVARQFVWGGEYSLATTLSAMPELNAQCFIHYANDAVAYSSTAFETVTTSFPTSFAFYGPNHMSTQTGYDAQLTGAMNTLIGDAQAHYHILPVANPYYFDQVWIDGTVHGAVEGTLDVWNPDDLGEPIGDLPIELWPPEYL